MLTMQLYTCVLLHMTLLQSTYGDFYTSIHKLTMLVKEEQRLIDALHKYITEETKIGENVPEELYSVLQKSEEAQADIVDIETYPENPINAFHLLYRTQRDWTMVHDVILCETCKLSDTARDFDVSYHVAGKHTGGLPTERDVEGAADSVLRLWNVYQFDLKEFFDGVIFDTKTTPLTAEEILYIARRADSKDQLYEAFHWLTELLRRFKKGEYGNSNVKEITVAKALAGVYNKNGMPWKSLDVLKDFKSDPKLARDLEYYKMRAASVTQKDKKRVFRRKITGPGSRKLYLKYEALCRGDIKSAAANSVLYCYWRNTAIPYKMVKEEVVHRNPKITLFHDVIYNDEIKFLKNESFSKIERSSVLPSHDGKSALGGVVADGRVSQTAWLSDFQYPVLRKLAKRIEIITGLQAEHRPYHSYSEEFQILNYGVGGMYEPHLDPLGYRLWDVERPDDPVQCKGSGDRLATWMFYLSDVKVGGATVFPPIKTRVPAIKGAAAFWYNIKRNGDQDFDTQHAGCPVLLGSKWVSNKWIREEGQMLRRPCGIDKDDTDDVKTNDIMAQWRS